MRLFATQIHALWGRRAESFDTLTDRWMKFLEIGSKIDSCSLTWEYYDRHESLRFYNSDFREERTRVEDAALRHKDGHKLPDRGVHLWLSANCRDYYLTIHLDVYAGNAHANNAVNVTIRSEPDESVSFAEFAPLRALLLAAAETYDATQGLVCPREISNLWVDPARGTQTLDLAWMTYVAPRFAHRVTPPHDVIVEYRPDGGLYMAATKEFFQVANPDHLAAARRVRDSLAAYNEVPWGVKTSK